MQSLDELYESLLLVVLAPLVKYPPEYLSIYRVICFL